MRESAFTLQDILWLFQIWLSLVCSSLTRIIWFWHYWLHPPMIWRITSRSGFLTTPAPKICGKEGFGRLALIGLGNRGGGNEQQIGLRETKRKTILHTFYIHCSSHVPLHWCAILCYAGSSIRHIIISAGHLFWIYCQLIGMSYIALARQI